MEQFAERIKGLATGLVILGIGLIRARQL